MRRLTCQAGQAMAVLRCWLEANDLEPTTAAPERLGRA